MGTLGVYLNDHLGIIAGEIELARRVAEENQEALAPLARFLSLHAGELERQQESLREMLRSIGEEPSTLKQAVGWMAEKVGRLKPNGPLADYLSGYTDLARVIELEALTIAAESRLLMWSTLSQLDAPFADATLWREKTARQIDTLRNYHLQAIPRAFEQENA